MKNLNLLFNKHYFSGIEKSGSKEGKKEFMGELKKRNQEICCVLFSEADYLDLDEKVSPKDHRFLMKTSYPGLLVGTGYAHEAEAGSDDCIKLGFSFDYVSGQPYVPGSSVKGMLRSCFKEGVAREVLKEGLRIAEANLTPENLKALETNIFEGNDIFFDAVLRSGDKDGYVMAQDYITPHKGATKDPTPLMMIKVRPGVVFEFRFKLYDFKSGGRIENERLTVSAVQKKKLFQILIELFGVGSKTNVGYGVLLPADKTETVQVPTQTETQADREHSTVQQPGTNRDAIQTLLQPQNIGAVHELSAGDNNAQKPKKQYCAGCKEKKKKKVEIGGGEILCPECLQAARRDHICAACNFGTMAKQPSDQGYDLFCTKHWQIYYKK